MRYNLRRRARLHHRRCEPKPRILCSFIRGNRMLFRVEAHNPSLYEWGPIPHDKRSPETHQLPSARKASPRHNRASPPWRCPSLSKTFVGCPYTVYYLPALVNTRFFCASCLHVPDVRPTPAFALPSTFVTSPATTRHGHPANARVRPSPAHSRRSLASTRHGARSYRLPLIQRRAETGTFLTPPSRQPHSSRRLPRNTHPAPGRSSPPPA